MQLAQHSSLPQGRILRPKMACQKLGVGLTFLYDLLKSGQLTRVRLGARAVGIAEDEIDRWIAARKAA